MNKSSLLFGIAFALSLFGVHCAYKGGIQAGVEYLETIENKAKEDETDSE